jgi:uncharacterized membrane protein (UPF0127 family)
MEERKPNYVVSNLSRKKSARLRLEIADNDFSRMRGLMFREKIVPILFIFGREGLFPIHSHFVAAPFDAVYVSQQGIVTEIFRKIPPNTNLVSPKKDASYLIELPPEDTGRLAIRTGDKLEWRRTEK